MWLARNKAGDIHAFKTKPLLSVSGETYLTPYDYYSGSNQIVLSDNEFPEVTFENSPVEIINTGLSDILDTLNNISETLASDIEQENNNLLSCDNSSDILDKTYNYRLGLIQGYAHAQCLISQMFAKKVSESLKINKNVNK